MAELILSDGTRSYDFLGGSAIYVQADGIELPVVARDDTFVETPDSDGRRRIRSKASNPEGSFAVFVNSADAGSFWDDFDNLQDLVESAHREKGTLTYTPPGGSAVAYDLEAISLTELPQRGTQLRQNRGEATVAFEAKPYGRVGGTTLVSGGTLTGPIDAFTVADVPGQVAAWGNLRLDDPDSQARNHVEVGVQHNYDPADPEPLLLEAVADITAVGGSSNTRSGSHSTNIIRCALTTSPVVVCSAEDQPHYGKWKVRARVYPSDTTVRVRLAWRAGTAPFAQERWITVPGASDWYDLDLGTVDIRQLPSGHTSEFRVEAITTSGIPTVDVDILSMIPADSYTRLRGSSVLDTPTSPVAGYDDFSATTTSALAGQTPQASTGNWLGAGDADDFVGDGSGLLMRTALSDSSGVGRYAICGTGTTSAITVSVDFADDQPTYQGVIARYVDTNNWVRATWLLGHLRVQKRVAGTVSYLTGVTAPVYAFQGGWKTIKLAIAANGVWALYFGAQDGTLTWKAGGTDTTLATAATLDDGMNGIYDECGWSTSTTRYYDNFTAIASASAATLSNPAINADYGLDLLHNTAYTDNTAGTGQGVTPTREGQYLYLPPTTRGGREHRVVIRARRDDVDSGFPDTGLSDDLTGTLTVTPRVHLLGP